MNQIKQICYKKIATFVKDRMAEDFVSTFDFLFYFSEVLEI